MIVWVVVIFFIAAAFAVKDGLKKARAAVSKKYRAEQQARRQLTEDAIAAGLAPRASRVGENLGAAAAATISGPLLAWKAFWANWRDAYRAGKKRGEALQAGTVRWTRVLGEPESTGEAEVADVETNEPEGSTVPEANDDPVLRGGGCSYSGNGGWQCPNPPMPGRSLCADHQQQNGSTTPTPQGARPMPIETATHGETRTLGATLAELDAIISNARAEFEDATGDQRRAEDERTQVENMVNSLRGQEVDQTTVAAVEALLEPFQLRANQAADRAKAAEHRLYLAEAARTTAANNHAGIRDAVHASAARQAANGSFYDE